MPNTECISMHRHSVQVDSELLRGKRFDANGLCQAQRVRHVGRSPFAASMNDETISLARARVCVCFGTKANVWSGKYLLLACLAAELSHVINQLGDDCPSTHGPR